MKMTSQNISYACKIKSTNKKLLHKQIKQQWDEVVKTGNVITPSLTSDTDTRSGDIYLDFNAIDDNRNVLRVNDIFIVSDKDLITQDGFLIPIKFIKKSLLSSVESEIDKPDSEYEFDAWFVKLN